MESLLHSFISALWLEYTSAPLGLSILLSWSMGFVLKQPALLTSQNHPKHTGAKGCEQAV